VAEDASVDEDTNTSKGTAVEISDFGLLASSLETCLDDVGDIGTEVFTVLLVTGDTEVLTVTVAKLDVEGETKLVVKDTIISSEAINVETLVKPLKDCDKDVDETVDNEVDVEVTLEATVPVTSEEGIAL